MPQIEHDVNGDERILDFLLHAPKDNQPKITYRSGPDWTSEQAFFKQEKLSSDLAILKVSGYASTNTVDAYNEVVEPTAFAMTMEEYMKHPMVLFGHEWFDKPIGKVVKWELDDVGLWVEVEIANTDAGRDVATLIEFGILNSFSIGFGNATRMPPDEGEEGPIRITKLRLFEISIVNLPANPDSLFNQAKLKQISLKSLKPVPPDGGGTQEGKGSIMPAVLDQSHLETIKKAEKMVGEWDQIKDSVATKDDLTNMQKMTDDLNHLMHELSSKHKELEEGKITKSELKTFTDKIGEDILNLSKEIDDVKKARQIRSTRFSTIDWRLNAKGMNVLYDEHNRPLPESAQMMWKLHQMPVAYEGEEGRHLQLLRNLNDHVVIVSAVMRAQAAKANKPFFPENLKTYQLYKELLEIVHPDYYKALYSTGSTLGDELVPTELSAEFYDLYRMQATVEPLFAHFDMPTNPFDWPIKSGNSTMYRAGEASSNNPNTLIASNLSTTKVTFNAETFAISTLLSPQLIEDSIVLVVPIIREDMAQSMAHGYDSLIINGDDSATHQDNASTTLYAATAPETYEKGLRKYASAASKTFNVQSTVAGYGDATAAFHEKDVRYTRKLCTKMGSPSTFAFIVGPQCLYHILNMTAFSQPGTYNAGASWRDGTLNMIDGSKLVVSEDVPENLNASGVYDNSTTTQTVIIGCNTQSFKVGEKRGITVEFEKNIQTQQWNFVTTMRKSFQKMTASTLYPVALGYNITA